MAREDIILCLSIILLLSVPLYLFWPFELTVSVRTPSGQPLEANLTVFHDVGVLADSTVSSGHRFSLWKGTYILTVHAPGFDEASFEVANPLGIRLNENLEIKATLKPSLISLATIDFRDPTRSLKLYPWLEINGTTIGGERVLLNISQTEKIQSGHYTIRAADPHFNGTIVVEPERFPTNPVILSPTTLFESYTVAEVNGALHFLDDYLALTSSLPAQFALPSSNRLLTLGDLLALSCQHDAAQRAHTTLETYWLPRGHTYTVGSTPDCYASSLDGTILAGTKGIRSTQSVFLNTKRPTFPIALTFELQSGRYVHQRSEHALSPCHNATTRLGIEADKVACNSPSTLPWFSPLDGPHTGAMDYPWATGREGLDDILSLPERYRVPITLFVTPRDLIVLASLDPDLLDRLKGLVASGLIEIGAYPWYYSLFGAKPVVAEQDDIRRSKAYLEETFEVAVSGIRSPGFSLIRNNVVTHDDIITHTGFTYYSGLREQQSIHNTPVDHQLGKVPFSVMNASMARGKRTILTAPPWAFTHDERTVQGETSLRRNPGLHQETMTTILRLISMGGVPRRMDSISSDQDS